MALDDRKEAVQLPLEKDTNLIAKDKSGQAALHSAVFALRKEVMQLLLEKSADVTAKDDSGRMVLHYATLGGREFLTPERLLTTRCFLRKQGDGVAAARETRRCYSEG